MQRPVILTLTMVYPAWSGRKLRYANSSGRMRRRLGRVMSLAHYRAFGAIAHRRRQHARRIAAAAAVRIVLGIANKDRLRPFGGDFNRSPTLGCSSLNSRTVARGRTPRFGRRQEIVRKIT